MKNIKLNDGNIVPIASIKDTLEIIAENLSYELSAYLNEEISNADVLGEENDFLYEENKKLNEEINRMNDDRMEAWKQVDQLKDELEEERDRTWKALHGTLKVEDCLPFC